jgi:hypothetical protein
VPESWSRRVRALAAAQRRIAELEDEVKILRKAAAAVEEVVPPKVRYRLVAELAAEGILVKQACLALGSRGPGTTTPEFGRHPHARSDTRG